MSTYLYGGLPPHEHVETSREAALSMLPFIDNQQERVFQCIYGCRLDGATDDEIETATGICHASASARRRALVLLERVVNLGIKRRTSHGRFAFVHVAVEFAPPELLAKLKLQTPQTPQTPNGPLKQGGLFDQQETA